MLRQLDYESIRHSSTTSDWRIHQISEPLNEMAFQQLQHYLPKDITVKSGRIFHQHVRNNSASPRMQAMVESSPPKIFDPEDSIENFTECRQKIKLTCKRKTFSESFKLFPAFTPNKEDK